MAETWRLIDTGLASAPRNIAHSRALLEARHANEIPSTLRFLRYTACALLGSRQSAAQEIDLEFCAAEKLPVQRRVTNGAALILSERELGWELYLHREDIGPIPMSALAKRVGHAAATALSAAGLHARYRAEGEIEIDGATVCVLTQAAEGSGVLVQGFLLLAPDLARMNGALRMPQWVRTEALAAAAGSRPQKTSRPARVLGLTALLRSADLRRVRGNLAEAFESEFDIEFSEGELTLSEHARCERALREIDTPGWVGMLSRPSADMPLLEGEIAAAGGPIRFGLKYERSTRTIRQVWFSAEALVASRQAMSELEAALRDVSLERLPRRIATFFASRPALPGLAAEVVVTALERATRESLDA